MIVRIEIMMIDYTYVQYAEVIHFVMNVKVMQERLRRFILYISIGINIQPMKL